MTTAPSYDTAHAALRAAVGWIRILCEAVDIDPAETSFTVRSRGPDGEVLKEFVKTSLADSLVELDRVIDRGEPRVDNEPEEA